MSCISGSVVAVIIIIFLFFPLCMCGACMLACAWAHSSLWGYMCILRPKVLVGGCLWSLFHFIRRGRVSLPSPELTNVAHLDVSFWGFLPPFSETGTAGRLAMTPWHLNGFQWSELQSSRVHVKRLTKEPSPQPAVWRKGCCTKQLWPIQLTPSFFLSKCQYFVSRMNCECVLISLITMKCPGAHGWKSRTHPQEAKAQMCQQFC